jgi:hypothetical protein
MIISAARRRLRPQSRFQQYLADDFSALEELVGSGRLGKRQAIINERANYPRRDDLTATSSSPPECRAGRRSCGW